METSKSNKDFVIIEGKRNSKKTVFVKFEFEWKPKPLRNERGIGDNFCLNLDEDLSTSVVPIWLRLQCNEDNNVPSIIYLGYCVSDMPKQVKKIVWKANRMQSLCNEDFQIIIIEEGKIQSVSGQEDSLGDGRQEVGIIPCLIENFVGENLIVVIEVCIEIKESKFFYDGFDILRRDEDLTDLKLHCEMKEFSCHCVVLAALSPVFRAMLCKKNFKESSDKIIYIKDFTKDELEVAVNFMYTQNENVIGKHAAKMLLFADKYDIESLKSICETLLIETLTRKNAIEMLQLAIKSNSDSFKNVIIKKIRLHWSYVRENDEFKQLLQSDAKLATELLFTFH